MAEAEKIKATPEIGNKDHTADKLLVLRKPDEVLTGTGTGTRYRWPCLSCLIGHASHTKPTYAMCVSFVQEGLEQFHQMSTSHDRWWTLVLCVVITTQWTWWSWLGVYRMLTSLYMPQPLGNYRSLWTPYDHCRNR